MKEIIRYQCKTDLKLMRKMLNMSKIEVAEKVFCSIRTIERIEFENATTNEKTAKILSDLYAFEFDEQFYVINKRWEDFIKKGMAEFYKPGDYKVNYSSIFYCLYVRKTSSFQRCILGKGRWVKEYNRNKEVRILHEIDIKTFTELNPDIPVINESAQWYHWYYGLTVGKLYKVAVSRECMKVCLRNCLEEVVIRKDGMFYFDNTSDMMYWGVKKP